MNNSVNITPAGAKRVGLGLLSDNWMRAAAVVSASIFGIMLFFLMNSFVTTLVGTALNMESTSDAETYNSIIDYFRNQQSKGLGIESAISLVLAAFYFMIISPLNVGTVRWYRALAQCGRLQVGQIFYYYRSNGRFIEALVFELNRLFRCACYMVLCFAPAAAAFGYSRVLAKDAATEENTVPMLIAAAALLLGGLVIYGLLILRFFLARYLLVSDKGLDIQECFKTSAKYMRGMHGKVLRVIISLIPYIFTCIFIAPIIFVVPMYQATMAACAQDIIDARTPV